MLEYWLNRSLDVADSLVAGGQGSTTASASGAPRECEAQAKRRRAAGRIDDGFIIFVATTVAEGEENDAE
jgi:hypothetical protein